MSELLEQFASVLEAGRPAALATLVVAAGATPKKTGSTMWVSETGEVLGSVTIGGCVDARVIDRAGAVILSGQPELLQMSLGDEDAWALGLTCGGSVDVLIQRVDAGTRDDASVAAYEAASAACRGGRASLVVAPLNGSAERLAIDEEGATTGTLGDALLDATVRELAPKWFGAQSSGVDRVVHNGSELSLFFERLAPPETLVIYGASHVAMSLAVFAREMGIRVAIVDGRDQMATRKRFPTADEIHVGMPSEYAEQHPATKRTYLVLLAHDYKYELPVLREVLRGDAGYIGMLGSRRRGETIKAMLREEGFSFAELSRLRTPIGLAIGAKSAAEIALAIASEVVAVREGRDLNPSRGEANDPVVSEGADRVASATAR
jgi:xanthine dehydrogenase accessory factor